MKEINLCYYYINDINLEKKEQKNVEVPEVKVDTKRKINKLVEDFKKKNRGDLKKLNTTLLSKGERDQILSSLTKQRYELIKFSAGGLRDFSRIAASNEIMWRDIFFNNQKNISRVIDLFIKNLRLFKKDIKSKNDKLIIKKLVDTKKVRKKIIKLKHDIDKPDFGRS